MRSPATRCVGSESNWMGSHCCTLRCTKIKEAGSLLGTGF